MKNYLPSQRRNLLWFAFIISGASGLIYEILWMRLLAIAFGNTVVATTIVLSAYMAGLALGGFFLGRSIDRTKRPLLSYGLMQYGILLSSLLLFSLLRSLPYLYATLYQKIRFSPAVLNAFWFSISFLLLIIPTSLMGGTWPALSKFLTEKKESLGASAGSLYSLNTLGAVLGSLAAGFWLLGNIGLKNTNFLAAAINFISAAIAILISFRAEKSTEKQYVPSIESEIEEITFPDKLRRVALWTIFVSGLCALAYEVLWTHTLIFFLDNSTWAFTTMLATFLSGITIGSWAVRRFADRKKNLLELLGFTEIAIGILAFLSLIVLWQIFPLRPLWSVFKNHNILWFLRISLIFGSSLLVILPATIFMGAAFVFASKINTKKLTLLGKNLGDVYGFNTLGAIAGPLLAGFVLLPLIGLKKSIFAFVILNVITGAVVLFFARNYTKQAPQVEKLSKIASGTLITETLKRLQRLLRREFNLCNLFLNLCNHKNRLFQSSSSVKVSTFLAKQASLKVCTFVVAFIIVSTYVTFLPTKPFLADNESPCDETIFYKEGPAGAVKVWRRGITKAMAVDGHEIAATSAALDEKQKLLAHLPMLISPLSEPRKALTIGFGSGITAGSMSLWESFDRIDAIEIVPTVVEAAELFSEENKNILRNPRANIVVSDGVNFLLTSQEEYDLIVSDGKMNPTFVGNGVMYSQDYYRLCFSRLSDDGVFAQWIPLYIPPSVYRIILRTFSSVFPYYTVWSFESGNTIYLGSKKPQLIDYSEFKEKLANPAISEELAKFDLSDPLTYLSSYVADEEEIKPTLGEGPINNFDYPCVEFNAPFEFMRTFTNQNESQNLSFLLGLDSDVFRHFTNLDKESGSIRKFVEAKKYVKAGQAIVRRSNLMARGKFHFQQALKIDPDDKKARELLEKVEKEKESAVRQAEQNPNDAEGRFRLGTIYFFENEIEKAIAELETAKRLGPNDLDFVRQVDNYLGNCFFMRGELEKAEKAYLNVLKIKEEAGIYYNLGLCYEAMNRPSDAEAAYRRAADVLRN